MFAEDVDLLPGKMFGRMLDGATRAPRELQALASSLFAAMQAGGRIGFERVDLFNGGLFDDDSALPLTREDIALVRDAAGVTGPRSTPAFSARCSSAVSIPTNAASWARIIPTAIRSCCSSSR